MKTLNPVEYTHSLKRAADLLQTAEDSLKDATSALSEALDVLIHEDAPQGVRAHHADIVDAGDHVEDVLAKIEALGIKSKEVAKAARGVATLTEQVDAAKRLYGQLLTEASDERATRKDPQQRLVS